MNQTTTDPHGLNRFVEAQEGAYPTALRELKAGSKHSHWMWFIFPQIAGLGFSAMAQRYAIRSMAEAKAYLAHPLLGSRLAECAAALLQVQNRSAEEIMGHIDALKLRSSMTLFARASDDRSAYRRVLEKYYAGIEDEKTIERL